MNISKDRQEPKDDRIEVRITEGSPVALADGILVSISKVTYAHLEKGGNLSICTLTLSKGGETHALSLERDHSQPLDFKEIFGLRVALNVANAYQSPGSAVIVVEKLGQPHTISSLLTLRDFHRADLIKKFSMKNSDVFDNVTYEKLKNITRIHNPATHPGHFYLHGDKIAVIYIASPDLLGMLSPAIIREELKGEGIRLPSRVSKTANHYVYPQEGFAYSEDGGKTVFIEIFQPTTLQNYQNTIYEEPGPFLR